MHVLIETDSTDKAFFGVSDFQLRSDGQIDLYLNRHPDVPFEDREFVIDGTLRSAVREPNYNPQGAFETLAPYVEDDDTDVIIGPATTAHGPVRSPFDDALEKIQANSEQTPDVTTIRG